MLRLIGLVLVGVTSFGAMDGAWTDWKPSKAVEFVVTAGPGGGTDQFARVVQAIVTKYELLGQPAVVVNKGGGSGAEGFLYAKLSAGDPHKIVFATSNEWMLPMVAKLAFRYDDLKPVAAMAFDEFILWVRPDAPYQDAKSFIAAAKAGDLKMGGSQSKDVDQLLTSLIQKATGVKFTYVPFKSGNEAAVQLAGSHIDSNTNNPSENVGQWKGGSGKPLCVFSPQRMGAGPKVTETQAWADISTCREAGIPIDEFRMPRTIFTPAKVSGEATHFYVELLRKVRETPEWKDYIQRSSQTDRFMDAVELTAFIGTDEPRAREIFRSEGWLVN
jgi:putative tricarboxylic transport membrane protein